MCKDLFYILCLYLFGAVALHAAIALYLPEGVRDLQIAYLRAVEKKWSDAGVPHVVWDVVEFPIFLFHPLTEQFWEHYSAARSFAQSKTKSA